MTDETAAIVVEMVDNPTPNPTDTIDSQTTGTDSPAPKVEKTAKTIVTPEEGIGELQKQLEAARANELREANARREAQRQTADAERRAAAALAEKQKGDVDLLSSSVERVRANTEILKQRLSEARAQGDVGAEADVMVELSKAGHQLSVLEMGLEQIKGRPEPKPKAAPQTVDDPVERLASQLTPRSAQWVRSHPEFVRDPLKNQRMLAAHNLAVTDGMEPDTDEYFSAIENTLRIKPTSGEAIEVKDAPRGSVAPAAAPVSRTGTTNGGARPTVVRLTQDERDMADACGQSYEEYAKQKLRMIGERNGTLQ